MDLKLYTIKTEYVDYLRADTKLKNVVNFKYAEQKHDQYKR